MPNPYRINIEGLNVKELRCKNDECRALICYESIKVGVVIYSCPACSFVSVFNMRYHELAKDFMSKLQKQFPNSKGGEK